MRIGIMGGTFDPVHLGHLLAAERAREEAGLEQVWFLPSHTPPHKTEAPKTTAEQRWEMVVRAIAGNDRFRAEDMELRRGGVSYTIDTVLELRRRYPDHRFSYIVGADMVRFLPQWHRIDEIVRHVSFIGLVRPGYELNLNVLPETIRSCVTIADMPPVDISSTQIRAWRSAGKSVRYLVPESVYAYMEEKRLYGSQPSG